MSTQQTSVTTLDLETTEQARQQRDCTTVDAAAPPARSRDCTAATGVSSTHTATASSRRYSSDSNPSSPRLDSALSGLQRLDWATQQPRTQ